MTSNNLFLTEINNEIQKVNDEIVENRNQLIALEKDRTHFLSITYASKQYYFSLVRKFELALKKAKLEAIRDHREHTFKRCVRPVYLHKIDQYVSFMRNAPRRLQS